MSDEQKVVEVDINRESGKAIVEDKTAVPFKTFVGLILQRKVQTLFKSYQNDPVIIDSDLLTKLASAPDDRPEDRTKMVVLSLGIGVLMGIFVETAILLLLNALNIQPTFTQLLIILGMLFGLVILGLIIEKIQATNMKQVIYDRIEQIGNMLG